MILVEQVHRTRLIAISCLDSLACMPAARQGTTVPTTASIRRMAGPGAQSAHPPAEGCFWRGRGRGSLFARDPNPCTPAHAVQSWTRRVAKQFASPAQPMLLSAIRPSAWSLISRLPGRRPARLPAGQPTWTPHARPRTRRFNAGIGMACAQTAQYKADIQALTALTQTRQHTCAPRPLRPPVREPLPGSAAGLAHLAPCSHSVTSGCLSCISVTRSGQRQGGHLGR